MCLGIRVGSPARQLRQRATLAYERETVKVVLARLQLHLVEVNRPLIYAHGGTRLHSLRLNAQFVDAFGEESSGRFGAASTAHLFATNMHQAAEEGARGDNHGACRKGGSPQGAHSAHAVAFGEDFYRLVLPDVQVVGVFEAVPPLRDETGAVTLGARTPHGRTFRAVEHTELDGGGVCHLAHLSAQRVDFADNLSLGNATHCGVAAHLGYFVHVHRQEARLCPHARRCTGCLAARMPRAHYKNVVVKNSVCHVC